jgi:hypothetical protein
VRRARDRGGREHRADRATECSGAHGSPLWSRAAAIAVRTVRITKNAKIGREKTRQIEQFDQNRLVSPLGWIQKIQNRPYSLTP